MKNIKYLYVLFVFCCSYANAQYIIAGQHSANDYYYKYTPDTVIKFYNPSTYLIDLNNDGVKDFKFTVLPYNDLLGATAYYCNVSGLNNNNNKVALAYFDSCFYKHYVSQYIIEIVQSFNYNDTININANWDSLVYIEDVYSSSQMGIQCFDSFTDSAYIGLKVFMGTQPVYGWIKIISSAILIMLLPGIVWFTGNLIEYNKWWDSLPPNGEMKNIDDTSDNPVLVIIRRKQKHYKVLSHPRRRG